MGNTIREITRKINKNEIHSSKMNIFKYFYGDNLFWVKEYQRRYKWNTNQIKTLMTEISKNKTSEYFLGMVILKKEESNRKYTEISIVDGQQRITTLLLILRALENKFRELDKNNEHKDKINLIKNTYIIQKEKKERFKIVGIRDKGEIENIFLNNIDKDEIKKMKENKGEDHTYINTLEKIIKFLNDMDMNKTIKFFHKIEKITFSVVILGKNMNENKIFEDLNSKGTLLKIDDLLRNYYAMLFKQHTMLNKEQLIEEVNNFERIINSIEGFLRIEKNNRQAFSGNISRWFKHFIAYKTNCKKRISYDNDRGMYESYKKSIDKKLISHEEILIELGDLDKFLEFCIYISSYNEEKNNEENNIKFILNDIDFFPLLYPFYKKFYGNDNWYYVLNFCLFLYMVSLCSSSNAQEIRIIVKKNIKKIKTIINHVKVTDKNIFLSILKSLYGDQNIEDMIKTIITEKLKKESNIYRENKGQKFILYFLSCMEKHMYENSVILTDKKYNIEHIIPQNPNLNLEQNKDSDFFKFSELNKNKISNCYLIEKKINEELKNWTFTSKQKYINEKQINIKIISTRKAFESKEHETELIKRRMKEIIKYSFIFSKQIFDGIKWIWE